MKAQTTGIIAAPIETVWPTIAQGGDVHRWFGDVIATCDISGSDRTCTMQNGATLTERIIDVDETAHRFRYAIDEHPLPATDVVATIALTATDDGGTQINWGADYTATPDNEALMRDTLQGIYAQGIASLETYHTQPK